MPGADLVELAKRLQLCSDLLQNWQDQAADKLFFQVRAVDESMAANFQQYGLASRSFDVGFEEMIIVNISGISGLLLETPGIFSLVY